MPHRLLVPQQAISNEIAQLYKLRIGRGPTRVSTTIAGDLVTCVLECTRTPQEATMFEAGAHDLVHDVRRQFQVYVASTLIEIVERATGRAVSGHVPGYSPGIDIAVETFMLQDGDYGTTAEEEADGDAVETPAQEALTQVVAARPQVPGPAAAAQATAGPDDAAG